MYRTLIKRSHFSTEDAPSLFIERQEFVDGKWYYRARGVACAVVANSYQKEPSAAESKFFGPSIPVTFFNLTVLDCVTEDYL